MSEGQARNVAWVTPEEPTSEERESLEQALSCAVEVVAPSLPEECFAVLAAAGAVVIDWELGDRWALDVVEALRSDARTLDLPVVIASDGPTRVQVSAALTAGADTIVQRPWNEDELRSRVRLRGLAAEDDGDAAVDRPESDGPDPEQAEPESPQNQQENPE